MVIVGTTIEADMKKFWPSLEQDNQSLWDNEWKKHGSCIFLMADQLKYFQTALEALKKFDRAIIDAACTKEANVVSPSYWGTCTLAVTSDLKYIEVKSAAISITKEPVFQPTKQPKMPPSKKPITMYPGKLPTPTP